MRAWSAERCVSSAYLIGAISTRPPQVPVACDHLKPRLDGALLLCTRCHPEFGDSQWTERHPFPTVQWHGGGFLNSKEGFHGQTIGERRAHWVDRGRKNGLDPVHTNEAPVRPKTSSAPAAREAAKAALKAHR